MQTHNVVSTLPGDMDYSPLWLVNPYDTMAFDKVMDLTTAMHSMVLAREVATVNCPIYSVEVTPLRAGFPPARSIDTSLPEE